MGGTMMRGLALILVLAAVLFSEGGPIIDEPEVNCKKAVAANTAVCDTYGAFSPVCKAAKAHYDALCDDGARLSSDERLKEANSAPSGDDEPLSLKNAVAPVLRGCQDEYIKAKDNCRTKVKARYASFKVESKTERSAKAARSK